MVFGQQHIPAAKTIYLGTQVGLGRHGIQGEDPSFDECRGKPRLERADFMLFVLHIDLEEHHASRDILGAREMPRLRFLAGRLYRFAIDGHLGMLQMPGSGV